MSFKNTFGFAVFLLCILTAKHVVLSDTITSGSVGINPAVWAEGIRLVRDGCSEDAAELFRRTLQMEQLPDDLYGELDQMFRIVELQNAMQSERNFVLWVCYAEKLRSYYLSKGMFSESFNLGKQVFAQVKTVPSGIEVVNTCLAFNRIEEALAFAEFLESEFAGAGEPLTGVKLTKCDALLAAGKKESARKLVKEIDAEHIQTPDQLLHLAKIQAETRQNASSVKSLTKCFELTPPSSLSSVKQAVKKSPEFQNIASAKEFRVAMATQSLVADVSDVKQPCLYCRMVLSENN